MEMARTSAPSLMRLWTWWRIWSLSRAPEGRRVVGMATPQASLNWASLQGLTVERCSDMMRSISLSVKRPRRRSSSSTTKILLTPIC